MSLNESRSELNNVAVVAGQQIAWRSVGSGRPLLMLNRFRAAMDDWDPALIEALSRNYQVISFDSTGVGASEGTVPETLEGAADVAMGVIQALGLNNPHVLGWSMGGMTSQILAAKYGEQISRVVLAGTTPSFAAEGTVQTAQEWLATATKETNTPEDMLYLFYAASESSRAAGMSSLARIGRGDAEAGAATKTSLQSVVAQGAATRKFFFGEDAAYQQLGTIRVPVLVANGDQDSAFAVANSVALSSLIPGAQLAIYPDAGHAFHFQYADRFAQDIHAFLS